jgi:hypothetical protein
MAVKGGTSGRSLVRHRSTLVPNWQTWIVADVVRWLIEHGQRSMFDPTIISLLRHTLALGPQGVKLRQSIRMFLFARDGKSFLQ